MRGLFLCGCDLSFLLTACVSVLERLRRVCVCEPVVPLESTGPWHLSGMDELEA